MQSLVMSSFLFYLLFQVKNVSENDNKRANVNGGHEEPPEPIPLSKTQGVINLSAGYLADDSEVRLDTCTKYMYMYFVHMYIFCYSYASTACRVSNIIVFV